MIALASIIPPLLFISNLVPDLNSAQGFFYTIACASTLFVILFFAFSLIGMGLFDFGADLGDGSMGAFSFHAILAFVLGLGWGGYISMSLGAELLLALLAGLLLGLSMFFIVGYLIKVLSRLQVDGNLKRETLVGIQGTVYVTIPPHGEVGGQVQLNHPSGMLTMSATQDGDEEIPSQCPIVVVEASTQQLLVKKI